MAEPTKKAGKDPETAAATGQCLAWSCKGKSTRFSFCEEHYEQFKFGLIKKTGEPVPDFEKKFEHFQSHRNKRGTKVA